MMRKDEAAQMNVDHVLDLHGEICPYTFVKSKLALEQMEAGQTLKIIVDNSQSASNVPRSIELEGHTILGFEKSGKSEWSIVVRKIAE